jgi:hypothetical protein
MSVIDEATPLRSQILMETIRHQAGLSIALTRDNFFRDSLLTGPKSAGNVGPVKSGTVFRSQI